MAESVFPGWLGEGLGLAGAAQDIFGGSSGPPRWQRRLMEQQAELQKQATYKSIRWRVGDAQQAGVHPLFALGANVSSPNPINVMAESGASRNRFGEASARIAALEAHAAAVEKDQAMADYYRALAAKERQRPAVGSIPAGSFVPERNEVQINPISPPQHVDWVKLEADPRMAASSLDAGVTAAVDHPGMRQFVLPGGFRMLMPATSGGGMPEDIDIGMWPMILGANFEKYGWRWIVDALNYATGSSNAEVDRKEVQLKAWLRRLLHREGDYGIPR